MSATQESLIEKQKERFESISVSVDNLLALGNDKITKSQIQTRLKLLDSNWEKFSSGHERLTNARITDAIRGNLYFTNKMYSICEEKYADSRARMTDLMEKLINSQPDKITNAVARENSNQVRSLPNIELPSFRGDYQHWRSFHDLFTSMVGNNTQLSEVEKFHYLKTSLKDEAALLIANIPVSSENFTRAWDILFASYENKRLLVDTHLDNIFKLKPIQRRSANDLKTLLAVTKESIGALQLLGAPTQHWDYIIVYIIVRRLDSSSHEAWELHRGSSTEPASFLDLETFLGGRIRALEIVETRSTISSTNKVSKSESHSSKNYSAKIHVASIDNTPVTAQSQRASFNQKCYMCNKAHYLSACTAYINLKANQRYDFLVEKGLCFNCLGPHRIAACRSSKRCLLCEKQHHTSIHRSVSNSQPIQSTASTSTKSITETSKNQFSPSQQSGVDTSSALSHQAIPQSMKRRVRTLLATALVRLSSSEGMELQFRALIDPGSQITIISESATHQLHLQRQRANIPLYGVGAQLSGTTKGIVNFTLKPHFTSPLEWDVTAYIIPKPTADLPSLVTEQNGWPHLHGLTLADPSYLHPGQIDLVIGIDVYSHLIEPELVKGPPGTPFARRTGLGWIISGQATEHPQAHETTPMQIYQCSTDNNLLDAIQRFWLQEEIQSSSSMLSEEEEECENHLLTTHSRDASGRYIVRLPFKDPVIDLGTSRPAASRMLSRLITKIALDSTLKNLYSDFLHEYLTLGHMRLIPGDIKEPKHAYYLPHHGVFKESSASTKLRVVFNGSSRSSNGRSLNDLLHIGKKLQNDLSDVISWWRQFPFVFSADMEKMFRQILIHEDDWDFQRILWSPTIRSDFICKYHLTTVTYGLGPAPFLANRVIQQLATDEGHRFPMAANILRHGTYVDDCFGGAYSLFEAKQLAHQLDSLDFF